MVTKLEGNTVLLQVDLEILRSYTAINMNPDFITHKSNTGICLDVGIFHPLLQGFAYMAQVKFENTFKIGPT